MILLIFQNFDFQPSTKIKRKSFSKIVFFLSVKSESKQNVFIKVTELKSLATERRPTKYLRTFLRFDSEI